MRWLLATLLVLCTACTQTTTHRAYRDSPDYVERVIEDVTAMIEGMAAAHAPDRVILRDPNVRSSQQPK